MRTEQPTKCFVPLQKMITRFWPVKHAKGPILNVPKWQFCCGTLLLVFGVRVSVTFLPVCIRVVLASACVAGWPPFGKKLLTRLTICSLCVLTMCSFSYFPFWF